MLYSENVRDESIENASMKILLLHRACHSPLYELAPVKSRNLNIDMYELTLRQDTIVEFPYLCKSP